MNYTVPHTPASVTDANGRLEFIDVDAADKAIAAALPKFRSEECLLETAEGRILREPLLADREYPPFHRVTMDGIAISTRAWERGLRQFRIEGVQVAGQPARRLIDESACIEVMTGAMLPEGCDFIIRIEDVRTHDGVATVHADLSVGAPRFVHDQGSDYAAGAELVPAGVVLDAPKLAVAASVGKVRLRVAPRLTVTIVSNGDELVGIGDEPEPHQIRISNVYGVAAMLKSHLAAQCSIVHLPDDPAVIQRGLEAAIADSDVLILSGGVSMGRFDYIPECLEQLGVSRVFHKVRQRPGKPMWFGLSPENKPVFALPGNPASTLVCARRFVVRHLHNALGASEPSTEQAILAQSVSFKPDLTYFLPVELDTTQGTLMCMPKPLNTSGDYATLACTGGFIELPRGEHFFPEGYGAPLYRWTP